MNDIGISLSKLMNDVRELAAKIAVFPTTVLIEGETGSGKEIMANFIHEKSQRANMPFIKINCGAIPESLIESELFGYERGAFTGAKKEGNPGLFEQAHRGTLLLDEIGELSQSMQVKLLRVLQDREVRRIGGSWSKTIDVRIITSTNKDLKLLVDKGMFREDLFYRLNVVTLLIPPLRKRRDDIKPLLDYYLELYCNEFNLNKCFTDEVFALLTIYDYPGNVRELRNIVEYACISSNENKITLKDLPNYIFEEKKTTTSLTDIVESAEYKAIKETLESENSIRKAAKVLQISNATLLRKMKKYNLEKSN
jgi:transcriptional regulator with PAS, ATPase and Fis domain